MPDRLQRLEAKLQALDEISAIQRLKYRYLRACDRKQPDELRNCLSPNSAVIAYEGLPPCADRDSFVDLFRQLSCRPNIIDMRHGANPIITLTATNTATGTWDLFFHSIDTEAGTLLQIAAEYTDEYARLDGRWWISRTATRRRSYLLQTIGTNNVPRISVLGPPPDARYSENARLSKVG